MSLTRRARVVGAAGRPVLCSEPCGTHVGRERGPGPSWVRGVPAPWRVSTALSMRTRRLLGTESFSHSPLGHTVMCTRPGLSGQGRWLHGRDSEEAGLWGCSGRVPGAARPSRLPPPAGTRCRVSWTRTGTPSFRTSSGCCTTGGWPEARAGRALSSSGASPSIPRMARKLTNGPAGVGAALPEGGWAYSLCPQHRPHPTGYVARWAAGHHGGDQAPPDSRHTLQELHGGPGGKPGL